MTAEGLVELVVVGLAVWAAVRTLPEPPSLDTERLFKLVLATLTRGAIEAEGLPVDAAKLRWTTELEARLPSLLGGLATAELEEDPAGLGADYDPRGRLGPTVDWEAIARWTPAVQEGLRRRLGHVVFAVEGWPDLSLALGSGGLRSHDLSALSGEEGLGDRLEAAWGAPSDRLVLIVRGAAGSALLAALAEDAPLRDRLLAFVALGSPVSADREAFRALFTHERLDTELQRLTLYLSAVDLSPGQPVDPIAVADQRFVDPPLPPTGRRSISVHDLGALPLAAQDPTALGRALLTLLAFTLPEG
jgi:hypothetical protein